MKKGLKNLTENSKNFVINFFKLDKFLNKLVKKLREKSINFLQVELNKLDSTNEALNSIEFQEEESKRIQNLIKVRHDFKKFYVNNKQEMVNL